MLVVLLAATLALLTVLLPPPSLPQLWVTRWIRSRMGHPSGRGRTGLPSC